MVRLFGNFDLVAEYKQLKTDMIARRVTKLRKLKPDIEEADLDSMSSEDALKHVPVNRAAQTRAFRQLNSKIEFLYVRIA